MVYHYRTVRCPHCGNIADKTRTVDSQELKGSPFRVCPHCDAVYFDTAYKEPAISLLQDRGGKLSFTAIVWVLISNTAVIFFLFESIKEHVFLWLPFLVFFAIALVFDIGLVRLIRNRIKAKEYHQKKIETLEREPGMMSSELAASVERMSNERYLDSLRAHGVDVPKYFYDRLKNGCSESNIQVPKSVIAIDSSLISNDSQGDAIEEDSPSERRTTNEIVFCRKCGARLPADSFFCPKCGEKVVKE